MARAPADRHRPRIRFRFAGIENELLFLTDTVMLFGDAKKMVSGIVSELKGR